jgi:PAS domain S-box-containing protein
MNDTRPEARPVPDDLPDVPKHAPLLRSRLLRPNRWRLWIQFLILGGLILVIPILLTSYQLLNASRDVLVEHEIVDLSDEANLRVNEMREDMAYLARDVRQAAAKLDNAPPADAVRRMLDAVSDVPSAQNGDPATIREARRKLLPGCAVATYAVRTEPDGTLKVLAEAVADGEPAVESPARAAVVAQCLAELNRRMRRPFPADRSALHLQEKEGDRPTRTLLAFGAAVPDSPVFYAALIDFSRYIRNRQQTSPRHYYFVTDPNGRVLIHPRPGLDSIRRPIAELIPWKYPADEAGSWFERTPDEASRQRRLARVVRDGGSRLPAAQASGLTFHYTKGTFPNAVPLDLVLSDPAASAAAVRDINAILRRELDADPDLRCGELSTGFGYLEVSHPNPERLNAIQRLIDEWLKRHTGGVPANWTRPLECRSLQGQLVPMRVDLNDQDDPAWLIVGASIEELREDIDDRFRYVARVWVFPVLAIAMACGFALVLTLTYSLGRLAKAAKRLSDGEEVAIPLAGPYEVSQLALTLDELARRVRLRDRELTERAARYQAILRAAGEGIVVSSADGTIEEANKAAGRMFGYLSDELIGKPVTALVQSASLVPAPADGLSVESLRAFSSSLDAVQGRRQDGSSFWLEMNLRPVALKDRVVIACIFRDVTLRREAEARIRRMNDELESRVKIRTAELEEANGKLDVALKQAEAASLAKDVFVANMSHELRQPLNIITGFTQVLIEEAEDVGASSIVPDLNKILTAANHLLELINDILDLAKIAAGRMELSLAEYDLGKLVADVRVLVGPLATVNRNRFRIEAPPDLGRMTADERRVRQILINLLSNAFKFTTEGEVALKVEAVREEGRDWIRFRVKDTGKGMTPEQLGRLFQRFYQADSSTTREQAGSGLGLTITQSFSELMGGQPVHVTSRVGEGSEFIVTLPRVVEKLRPGVPKPPSAPVAAVAPAAPGEPPATVPTGGTVLVIEDDPLIRELMARFLGKEGFHVVLATNGEEGQRLAQELLPNVITLDVMMPGADGWTVLANLKTHAATCDIPVVMLTIVDDHGRGFALGAADYLTKPIDWQRLGTILRKFLSADRHDTVLVVDDDANNREIIRRAVEREGCATVEAADGEAGLRAFAHCRPALVLLDLMMPVLDGFGFLDELGKRFPAHNVPVVVLTAKMLTPQDFERLHGRVTRILEKGDLTNLEAIVETVRTRTRK